MKKKLTKTLILFLIIAIGIFPTLSYASVEIGDAETPSKYEDGYIQHNCIDISEWNGNLNSEDFQKMKDEGIDSVIIRAGYSTLDNNIHKQDSYFEQNIKLAKEIGFDIGIYYFSSAITETEAIAEAQYLVEILKPYKEDINLPVAFDFETNSKGRFNKKVLDYLGKEKATMLCISFCDIIENEGYEPMVYASRNILDNYLDKKLLEEKYNIWLAQYTRDLSAPEYDGEYYIWQYSSNIKIDGIKHRIDGNYLFNKEQTEEDIEEENKILEQVEEIQIPEEDKDKIIEEIDNENNNNVKSDVDNDNTDEILEENANENEKEDIIDEDNNKEKDVEEIKEVEKEDSNKDIKKDKKETKKAENKKESKKQDPEDIKVTYKLDNSSATVPYESKDDDVRMNVIDRDGFKHKYTIYKIDESLNEAEVISTNLLTGYYTSKGEPITPLTIKMQIEPKLLHKRITSLDDISNLLEKTKFDFTYAEKDDNIYLNIKRSLAQGYPVIMNIKSNTKKWDGKNMILLIGMDENGKGIMTDVYDREWSNKDQRVKLVNIDELISYINGKYIYNITRY